MICPINTLFKSVYHIWIIQIVILYRKLLSCRSNHMGNILLILSYGTVTSSKTPLTQWYIVSTYLLLCVPPNICLFLLLYLHSYKFTILALTKIQTSRSKIFIALLKNICTCEKSLMKIDITRGCDECYVILCFYPSKC